VADKKTAASKAAPAKAAAKAPTAPAKKVAGGARRGEPAPKKSAPPPAKAVKAAKAPTPAKAAAKAPPPAKAAPKPEKASAPAKAAKAAPPKPAAKKTEPAKPEVKAKPDPKAAAKAPAKSAAPSKINGKEPEPRKGAAKAAPAPKPEPMKAEKPAKPGKAPKPPKLAPVEAAFAKTPPARPLAVAAGRAEPVSRVLATPTPKAAPKPLAAPKPVAPEPEQVGDLQAVPAFKGKTSGGKGMVLVGAIAGAFGVKGEVRLRAFTEKQDGVIAYGPLYGEDGKVVLKPKNWRQLKDGVAVVAPEVKSREQAEKMKGQKLFVPRSNLPATAEDEFYVVDLLGSKAETLDGTVLGDIVAVWNFGAGDIIEYRPPNGGPNVRVTFTKETVPHVDLAAKRVVIDPPAPEPVGK
jgi:16S rRNA processing protein RimM